VCNKNGRADILFMTESVTIFEQFKKTTGQLASVAGQCAQYEAELILEHVLGIKRSVLHLNMHARLTSRQRASIEAVVRQRLKREPLAYILGHTFFYNTDIRVNCTVLIPRPETEVLVDAILAHESAKACIFLDMGTGSGNICVALCAQRRQWKAVATDISYAALCCAKENCAGRIQLACIDRLAALKPAKQFDFIVSNPPYIAAIDMQHVDAGVREYEPLSALHGGEDGLDFYRCLAGESNAFINDNGHIYCEIGETQGKAVIQIFSENGWSGISVLRDLAGRQRILCAGR
jgi:release factor glutamine methyltransferase